MWSPIIHVESVQAEVGGLRHTMKLSCWLFGLTPTVCVAVVFVGRMMSRVNPVPEGFHTVAPYLVVKETAGVIGFYKQASGAEPLSPLADASWGDRFGKLRNRFGHHWSVATQLTELSAEEIDERARHALS